MKWRHKKDVSKKRAENMESLSVRAEEVNMFLLCTYIILVIFSLTESTTARVVLQQHSRHTSSMLMLFSWFALPFLFISSPFPSLMTWIREEQHQYPWKMCVNFLCIFFTRYKYTVIIALFLFILSTYPSEIQLNEFGFVWLWYYLPCYQTKEHRH